MERIIAAENFADNTSWEIYKNLMKLQHSKDLGFLVKAHELGGVKTWKLIKTWSDIYSKCKDGRRKLVFWGYGRDAKGLLDWEERMRDSIGYAYWPLLLNLPISAFVDKHTQTREVIFGEKCVPLISPKEVEANYRDAVFMIGTENFYQEIKDEIIDLGVDIDDIYGYYDMNGVEISGRQYFDDFWLPRKESIMIDAGMYRGETIFDIVDWNKGLGYAKIIGVEPDKENFMAAQNWIEGKNLANIELKNVGVGSSGKKYTFMANGNSGSHFAENGNDTVVVETIDSMVGSEDVSYIKMDIEGFELDALKGAKEVIQRCHPRLLVCLYHKPDDIIEIPQYILDLDGDYKFYIRHYSNTYMETLLYAL